MLSLKHLLLTFVGLLCCLVASGQQISTEQIISLSPEELKYLTSEWKGERFPDGRPKVPDGIMRRMKSVSVEEAWATMSNAGYRYQIAEGWEVINPDSVLVGRAVTA